MEVSRRLLLVLSLPGTNGGSKRSDVWRAFIEQSLKRRYSCRRCVTI